MVGIVPSGGHASPEIGRLAFSEAYGRRSDILEDVLSPSTGSKSLQALVDIQLPEKLKLSFLLADVYISIFIFLIFTCVYVYLYIFCVFLHVFLDCFI